MTIKKKLSYLLLAISVLPTLGVILTFELSIKTAQENISDNFRDLMDQKATMVMQQQLGDFAVRLSLRSKLLEEIVLSQSSNLNELAVEVVPEELVRGMDINGIGNDIVLADGLDKGKAERDRWILEELKKSCKRFELPENNIYHHIFVLADGSYGIYPGPEDGSGKVGVPQSCRWYQVAIEEGGIIGSPPTMDITGTRPVFTMANAVKDESGKVLGVVALETDMIDLFDGLKVNEQWSANCTQAIVTTSPEAGAEDGGLRIITRNQLPEMAAMESMPQTLREAFHVNEETVKKLRDDILAGRGGMLRTSFNDIDSICMYQPAGEKHTATVLIIPYENIVSAAATVEQEFFSHNVRQLTGFSVIIVFTVIFAIVTALVHARRITEPLMELSEAGNRLSRGEFLTQVDIRTGDELEKLGEVFNQIGPHLEQRQKMQESLELARSIQSNLLPAAIPEINGYELAGLCCYCDETGGDYYDYIAAPDNSGRIMLALGDVTGHGIAAALLMASARSLMRSLTSYCCGDLGELLGSFNRHFLADTDGSRFITMYCCVLEPDSDEIVWASGGHDPAILYRASDKSFCELAGSGMLLGVIEEAKYKTCGPEKLMGGDVMLIGTDGIWEAPNEYGELYGKDRLREVVMANAERSANEIADAILASIKEFSGNMAVKDDITMIVVKRICPQIS